MRLSLAILAIGLVGCAPRRKRLAELRDLRILLAIHNPPDRDGARAVVFLELGGRVPDCPAIRDDVAVTLDGRRVPMFAAGGKLGDFLSRGVTCYGASFRSSAPISEELVTLEIVDGPTRLAADFAGLGVPRTIRVEGSLRAGARASVALDPPSDEIDPKALVAFEYDGGTTTAKREVWVAQPEARERGKPLNFVVPVTARAGHGTLSLALGDSPKLIARASRCVAATECLAEIEVPRGEPSVAGEVLP